jgi:capsular exopolysaccharide synthesis family protein
MAPGVMSYCTGGIGPTYRVYVRTQHPDYAEVFLNQLVSEHDAEWQSMQREAVASVTTMLRDELDRLEERIKSAEDDVIEYERLHDLARTEARGAAESGVLGGLISRRFALQGELYMLEATTPLLKDQGVAVIAEARKLARRTAEASVPRVTAKASGGPDTAAPPAATGLAPVSDDTPEEKERERGWQELRVQLARLQDQEKELLKNLTPEHPKVLEVRRQMDDIRARLQTAAEIEFQNLKDRYQSLQIQLKAIEDAEYKWQAKDMLVARRKAELSHIQSIVGRYQGNYSALYSRMHDMRIAEELKAEHFRVTEPVKTSGNPAWPDTFKILVTAIVLGLGSGLGLALLAQIFDNRLQTVKDVETDLGVPFLGGVPFWAHSGLERTIRPIVTEEHSAGAVEAYRALRTSILSALNRLNEKIVLVTSADSREGKTLTALNIAIMIAQMGKKVLLVDMDLRRGRLHRSLGLAREPGVSDALVTGRSLREFAVQTKVENLSLIPTGSSVDNASEILQSTSLVSVFLDVQNDYDYILIDSSPILRVTDTVILATQGVGVVLYVARVNRTPKPLIKYSLDMLGEARVLGLVLNSIEMHKISSLYYAYQYPNYAYYSNAYSYGYSYYSYGDETKAPLAPRKRFRRQPRGMASWFGREPSDGG